MRAFSWVVSYCSPRLLGIPGNNRLYVDFELKSGYTVGSGTVGRTVRARVFSPFLCVSDRGQVLVKMPMFYALLSNIAHAFLPVRSGNTLVVDS